MKKITGELTRGDVGMILEFHKLTNEDWMYVRILTKGKIGWCSNRNLEVIP
jgi:hypothetical protein